jgi:hypothetical protein
MDISVHALKLIAIEIIVNAIILEIIALIAIVKTVKINHLNMPILISIPTTSILKIEKTRKYVLAQRVVAIKIIANASKVEINAPLYVDASDVKTLKIKLLIIINAVLKIGFVLRRTKYMI